MTAVLGIDTATETLAVAVARDGETLREVSEGPGPDGRPRHSTELLAAVEGCVEVAGGWKAIERIAVGLGPGSFTGLRIGIATARGLAQGHGVPLVGVGTLAALGRAIEEHDGAGARPALAVLDARRGQAFAALYGPGGEELWAPFVAEPAELADRVAGLKEKPLAGGDGSLRFAQELEAAGAAVVSARDPVNAVSARQICALGAAGTPSQPERIEPTYLRAPDAEKWLERDDKDFGS